MGTDEYGPIARDHRAPIVVTGFEPVDILEGLLRCIRQLEAGTAEVENAYSRVVRPEGNRPARAICGRGVRGGRQELAGPRAHPGKRLGP